MNQRMDLKHHDDQIIIPCYSNTNKNINNSDKNNFNGTVRVVLHHSLSPHQIHLHGHCLLDYEKLDMWNTDPKKTKEDTQKNTREEEKAHAHMQTPKNDDS